MAKLNILTPEEIDAREQKPPRGRTGRRRSPQRIRMIEGFKAELANATPGYGGDVLLGEDEDKRLVRQNLKAAADELGIALVFRPIRDKHRIHFRVITQEEKAARPPRGGRPRKVRPEVLQETSDVAPQEANATEPPAEPPAQTRRSRNQPATPSES